VRGVLLRLEIMADEAQGLRLEIATFEIVKKSEEHGGTSVKKPLPKKERRQIRKGEKGTPGLPGGSPAI
jgi:hypothetical protein